MSQLSVFSFYTTLYACVFPSATSDVPDDNLMLHTLKPHHYNTEMLALNHQLLAASVLLCVHLSLANS